jgi:hypothetical protein
MSVNEANRSRLDSAAVVPDDATLESSKARRFFARRTVTPTKVVREGGGVYVYRTRKPSSLIGLLRIPARWCWVAFVPCALLLHFTGGAWWFAFLVLLATGRHFAYVGETVSFKDRHGEHIDGGGRWKKRSAAWSDLDARCVLRIPIGKWKPLLRFVETLLIFFCQPVYNEKKNMWNLRRITRASALRMRLRRDRRRVKLNVLNLRAAHLVVIVAVMVYAHVQGVI